MTIAISYRKKEPAMSKRMVCACGNVAIRDASGGPVCQRCSDIERRTFIDYHSIERRNNHGGNRKGGGRKKANVIT
jgi:hypothetical protein